MSLMARPAVPLLWTKDRIYFVQPPALGAESVAIESIDARGGTPRLFATLPLVCDPADLAMSPSLERIICAFHDTTSDVWLMTIAAIAR